MMAAVSRFYTDLQGTIVSAGIGNNYTLTTTTIHAALADQSPVVFRADRGNVPLFVETRLSGVALV